MLHSTYVHVCAQGKTGPKPKSEKKKMEAMLAKEAKEKAEGKVEGKAEKGREVSIKRRKKMPPARGPSSLPPPYGQDQPQVCLFLSCVGVDVLNCVPLHFVNSLYQPQYLEIKTRYLGISSHMAILLGSFACYRSFIGDMKILIHSILHEESSVVNIKSLTG